MKMTVLCAGLSAPHAGWTAIDELAVLAADCFGATLLSSPAVRAPWPRRALGGARPRFAPIESAGGDVLFVVARGPEDLALAGTIADVRRKFGRIHAFVTDSYFHAGYARETSLYDSITVTAHEDVDHPRERFGIEVHQLYQGIDALKWAPRAAHARDIDVIGFGRMPASYHACFQRRFHDPASPWLYLHSPLGNVTGPTVHLERGMLFKLLSRARIALAYHLMVEPEGARPRSMMVTSRWLESLVSGCIVAGRRPVSRMASEMLAWSGATVELPHDPDDAADALEAVLRDDDALVEQRRVNMAETAGRHDWRWRLASMCEIFRWDTPARLRNELADLQQCIARISAGTQAAFAPTTVLPASDRRSPVEAGACTARAHAPGAFALDGA